MNAKSFSRISTKRYVSHISSRKKREYFPLSLSLALFFRSSSLAHCKQFSFLTYFPFYDSLYSCSAQTNICWNKKKTEPNVWITGSKKCKTVDWAVSTQTKKVAIEMRKMLNDDSIMKRFAKPPSAFIQFISLCWAR